MKTTEKTSDTPTTDLMEWSLSNKPITGREAEILNFARSLERRPSRDTWTSGKILPTPENDRQVADNFLAVCSDRENVTIEWFWFDANEWRDENDSPIHVSAWRRIPMDGIDEAVRQGDLA